jgi:hypothetical protein
VGELGINDDSIEVDKLVSVGVDVSEGTVDVLNCKEELGLRLWWSEAFLSFWEGYNCGIKYWQGPTSASFIF